MVVIFLMKNSIKAVRTKPGCRPIYQLGTRTRYVLRHYEVLKGRLPIVVAFCCCSLLVCSFVCFSSYHRHCGYFITCITTVLSRLLTSEHRHYGSFISDNSYLSLYLLSNLPYYKVIVIPLLLTYPTTLSLFISYHNCIFDIRTRSMWRIYSLHQNAPTVDLFFFFFFQYFCFFFLSFPLNWNAFIVYQLIIYIRGRMYEERISPLIAFNFYSAIKMLKSVCIKSV